MIDFQNKTVCLLGAGVSNMPLAEYLLSLGAVLTIRDKKPLDQLGEKAAALADRGVAFVTGDDYLQNITESCIFRSPGFRPDLPEIAKAVSRGAVLLSEMELFLDNVSCPVFAVTGSDGKSTTTTITHLLLSAGLEGSGHSAFLGGNIGEPLAHRLPLIHENDKVAVELSSFQLISMRQSPEVAVVTNVTPNHLDHHKDMQEYIESKKNIVLYQNKDNRAVLNYDNEITRLFDLSCEGEVVFFSRQKKLRRGAYLEGNTIVYAEDGKIFDVLDIREIKIPGMHNVENYMTAICAVWGDVSIESIREVARDFGGVEHRAEFVRELDGVRYYNDSIASSPTRTASGTLSLYDFKIILIAGGYDKHLDYTELGDVICDKVKVAILMGATADKIETAIRSSAKYRENTPVIIRVKDMAQAVEKARENAAAGDIVSMSPASASFDLYKDFDARGKHFKALVNAL